MDFSFDSVVDVPQLTLALQPSWNWISLNVNPVSARTENVFRPVLGDETNGYWFITVAGDEPTPLTIKVYDPATQKTTVVEQALQYTDDATLGTLDEPYIIQLNAAEGIETVGADGRDSDRPYKVLENYHVIIIRGGDKYDATGKKL